jgi:hypothetical protein
MSKKSKIAIVIVIIAIIVLAAVAAYLYTRTYQPNTVDLGTDIVEDEEPKKGEPKTFAGKSRPIAVMIDNSKDAMPHAGLNKAYIVYEMIAEGGESRLMALFKGVNLEKIGPVRSSRHYFLDYARENDAIYVHYGWSPEAESDIKTYGINNINGVTSDSIYFWRVSDKVAPHNAVTSTKRILQAAKDKGYRTTSTISSILNYKVDEFTLTDKYTSSAKNVDSVENSITNSAVKSENVNNANSNIEVLSASKISIPFSQFNVARWEYDAQNKNYIRYSKNIQEVDWDSKEPYTAKNIIITFIKNEILNDGENKGRQTMNTTGIKDGYYITNGEAIKIKCEKTTRGGKTVYKDLNGNVIDVNDGNTFIEICPIDAKVTIQ